MKRSTRLKGLFVIMAAVLGFIGVSFFRDLGSMDSGSGSGLREQNATLTAPGASYLEDQGT